MAHTDHIPGRRGPRGLRDSLARRGPQRRSRRARHRRHIARRWRGVRAPRRLARRLRAQYVGVTARAFSDGESRLSLRRAIPRDSTAIVVESTHPPVDTNLVHALTLVSAAASAARRAVAVIPYLGYARQDRAFLSGEVVTIREIARLLAGAGAAGLVSVDIHSEAARAHFAIPAVSAPAAPALAAHFAAMRMRDRIVVSPDAGGAQRAALLARELGCESFALQKRRDRRTGATSVTARGAPAVSGRDVILVDDMISTGGSISDAAALLRSRGCARVHAACTHALHSRDEHSPRPRRRSRRLWRDRRGPRRAARLARRPAAGHGPEQRADVGPVLLAELERAGEKPGARARPVAGAGGELFCGEREEAALAPLAKLPDVALEHLAGQARRKAGERAQRAAHAGLLAAGRAEGLREQRGDPGVRRKGRGD
ncbi:MAG: ribose-phosphate diphosphokinase [Thaumarchaeota archaeon S14]|nr:MAG: ribose-phosphate diphosphokinase [Thaumarchaeota archaeon S14]